MIDPRLYQAAVVRSAIALYIRTGIRAGSAYTPSAMRRTASRITGHHYKRGLPGLEAARADLSSHGVEFRVDTLDTGVCHMAFFTDPDGNALMLHHRYAPRGA